jgi:PAS domain S-box-containing protein
VNRVEGRAEGCDEAVCRFVRESDRLLWAVLNRDGCIQDCNRAVARLAGTPTSPAGRPLTDFLAPEERSRFFAWLQDPHGPVRLEFSDSQNSLTDYECSLEKGPDGSVFFAEPFAVTASDMIEQIARVNNELVDATRALHKKNRALEEITQRLASITEFAQDAILMMDPQGDISMWNPTAQKILGYTREEAIGKNLHDLLAPDRYLPAHEAAFPDFVRTGRGNAVGKTLELTAVKKDGREIPIELSLSAVSLGGRWHALGIVRDISERKEYESELQEREEKFRSIMESLEDPVYICSRDFKIEYINPAMQKWVGRDAVGEVCHQAIHGFEHPCPSCVHDRVMQGERVQTEVHLPEKKRDYLVSNTPIRHTDGAISKLSIYRDVSELKKKEAAEAAYQAKIGFLATMSHELRTPMNAILGFAHLIRNGPLTARQSEQLDRLSVSAQKLLGIINDVIDISRLESRQMTLDVRNFDLARIIDQVVGGVSEQMTAKNLDLTVQLGDTPTMLRGDGGLLKQILRHLLGNAVKFTEKGRIDVIAHVVDKAGSRVRLRLEIRDTGIGMTSEESARLFQIFEQADGSRTRKFGGAGLGLALSKRLVELMNGEIGVTSEPDQGTAVWMEIPFEIAQASEDAVYRDEAKSLGLPDEGPSEYMMDRGPVAGDALTGATETPHEETAGAAVEPAELEAILDRLEAFLADYSTSANDLFDESKGMLTAALGPVTKKIRQQIQNFDYDEALNTLHEARRGEGSN